MILLGCLPVDLEIALIAMDIAAGVIGRLLELLLEERGRDHRFRYFAVDGNLVVEEGLTRHRQGQPARRAGQ